MFTGSMLPGKTIVVAKGANSVNVTKAFTLEKDRWVVSGKKYAYIISDESVTENSAVFISSLKEFSTEIMDNNIMLLYPEVSPRKIKIYADTKPSIDIVCDYVVYNNLTAVATDKASELEYKDTHGIGVINTQEAIDYLVVKIKELSNQ